MERAATSRLALVALPLLAAAAAGCGEAASDYYGATARRSGLDPTTFYVNNGSEPEYVDPGMSHDGAGTALIMQMFEGLTTYAHGDMHPVPAGALRWDQSDDNRLFRFHLRPEARWSDGRPVTAHDYVYAWKRTLRPETASLVASAAYPIKNAEAFNRSGLKATRSDLVMREGPDDGAKETGRLSKGTFVLVLATSPSKSESAAGKAAHVLVRRFEALPTFRPGAAAEPDLETEPTGFVPAEELAVDDGVLGVRAVDDLTLEVELERPTPYFLDLTGHTALFPVREDVVEAFRTRGEPEMWTRPESIVTNGPYTLDEWTFRYAITMKRNPYYYDHDRLRIHRIVWAEVEQQHAMMKLYEAGDLDYIGDNASLPAEYVALLKTKKDFRRSFSLATYWYEINTREPPVDDVRVRRALNLAVDKQLLVDKVTQGGQLPASHYVPDVTGLGYADAAEADRAAGTDPFSAPDVVYNPGLARELLRQAGYAIEETRDGYRTPGFPPLEILYNTSEGHRAIAIAIQDMWRRTLGITVTLRSEEWRVMLSNVRAGNFQIARSGWTADYNHAHTWLDTFLSYGPNNQTGWSSQPFDEALRRAAATADTGESSRRYREAENLALAEMPKLPLYFYTRQALIKPWVMGFEPNARGVQLVKWLWIDPSRHEMPTDLSPAYPIPDFPPPGRVSPDAP